MHPQKYAQRMLEVGAEWRTVKTPGTNREAMNKGAMIQLNVP
jgi:hypothetical protein